MYRAKLEQQYRMGLSMDANLEQRMSVSIGVLERKHGRKVSKSEFIRLAIERACEKVEAI